MVMLMVMLCLCTVDCNQDAPANARPHLLECKFYVVLLSL